MTDHLEDLARDLAAIDGMTLDEARQRVTRDLAEPQHPALAVRAVPVWPPQKAQPDLVTTKISLPPTWAPENRDNECRCSRPSRDHRYVCDDCADLLSQALGDVPWTIEQLDITISRQQAATWDSSGSAALMWHERAANTRRELAALLAAWVQFCDRHHLRHSCPADGLPPLRDPLATSRWLLWRVDALTLQPEGPRAIEEVVELVGEARRIVTWKRRNRTYLGPCTYHHVCQGEVYADEDSDTGTCDQCNQAYPVAETRAALERALDDRLFTAAEIAHLTTYLGLDVPRRRIQLIVAQWHKRKRIVAAPQADENAAPRFRYGDVAPLLAVTYSKGA